MGSCIDFGLRTFHPNPGPVGAGNAGELEVLSLGGRGGSMGRVGRVDVGRDQEVKGREDSNLECCWEDVGNVCRRVRRRERRAGVCWESSKG